MEDKIKILKVEPGKAPEVTEIDNELRTMQEMVDGYIQIVPLDGDACLVCNEEGKLIGLEPNRIVGCDVIVGTFFIAGDDGGEDLCSLREDQIAEYSEQFAEPLFSHDYGSMSM